MAQVDKIKRSAVYVTVACRLPQGLKVVVEGLREPLHLHGTHSVYARFGFGMTEVKAEIWDQIKKQYGERPGKDRQGRDIVEPGALWLTNRIVFAANDPRDASAEAKERKGLDAGFNPIDTKQLDKIAKNIQPEGASDPGDSKVF